MNQDAIAIVVVALAGLWALWRAWRWLRGRGRCGCDDCPGSKPR